jgi:hypothetical protein
MDPEQFYFYTMGFFERSYTSLTPEEQNTLRERINLVRIPVMHKVTAPPDIMAPRKPCGEIDPDAVTAKGGEVKRFAMKDHPLFDRET